MNSGGGDVKDGAALLQAFFHDGSLRDVVVGGTRAQLEALASQLVASGWQISIDGQHTTLAELHGWVPAEDGALCVNAARNGCDLHLWAWSPKEPARACPRRSSRR